jgi:hypothetical protein
MIMEHIVISRIVDCPDQKYPEVGVAFESCAVIHYGDICSCGLEANHLQAEHFTPNLTV